MRALLVASLVIAACGVAGCETYTESVSCSMGQVLNEEDRCVPPPAPDGGVTIETCSALCEDAVSWTPERISCLREQLGMFGPLPTECTMDLTATATCGACVAAVGATDDQCASAPLLCP
ncbi:MAG: hypothetical protein RLO52_06425 [Sandaracinaceae bacterium]|nr:MAG: hypothetical protein EVA89_26930 [Sandaracinaceae bacterium]